MQNCQKTRELTWNNCSGAFAASPGKRELAQAVLSRQGHLLQHQSTSPRPASCPYIQANHHGAPQKDLATQRGLEEHPRGRDPAVLQAQAPTSPGPGHFSPAETMVCRSSCASGKSLGLVGEMGEILHPAARGSPQQGLLSAHPLQVYPGTRHSPRSLVPFHSTAVANVYFRAFSQFT